MQQRLSAVDDALSLASISSTSVGFYFPALSVGVITLRMSYSTALCYDVRLLYGFVTPIFCETPIYFIQQLSGGGKYQYCKHNPDTRCDHGLGVQ